MSIYLVPNYNLSFPVRHFKSLSGLISFCDRNNLIYFKVSDDNVKYLTRIHHIDSVNVDCLYVGF